MNENNARKLVGVFDSGIGGLSVLREIKKIMPMQPLYYIADQAHVPYGKRGLEEIKDFSFAITEFLAQQGAQLIVVACNTASAAALKPLRETFPELTFVGMEPAVKPATEKTHNGVVGVLATPATFQGKLYHTLVERFAKDVRILTHTCPGLVEAIENGAVTSSKTRRILQRALLPMVEEGADTIVLGCTHFPFVVPLIKEIVGPSIDVIDPSPAIAKRVRYLCNEQGLIYKYANNIENIFGTTGKVNKFQQTIHTLLGTDVDPVQLCWQDGKIQPS